MVDGRIARWASERPDAVAYTFVDYVARPDGLRRRITWSQVHRRASALAGRLGAVAVPGDRVALLAPSGIDYVVGLFATWYAGMVGVPLFPPDLPGHGERLAASYEDAAPACVLTTAGHAGRVAEFVDQRPGRAALLVVDEKVTDADTAPVRVAPDRVAYLQYTSGSTRTPAGVEISHANLAANVRQLQSAFLAGRPDGYTGVNWLPLFHDMGLLATVAMPLLAGTEAVFFDPVAFLMRPARWLHLLAEPPAAYTAAPDFAYQHCLRRVDPAEVDGLDLSRVFAWLNGAEPVRTETMSGFRTAYRRAGLRPEALCAAYGLAEATVFVAADPATRAPTVTAFDRDELAAGRGRPVAGTAPASTLVSCGRPAGQRLLIVDPECATALPDGTVGEIWVHGPNVARRYWRQPERSAQVFDATLADPPAGVPAGPWLRTGDLGLMHDGELYITGRRKDLLIVAGRNHYPQDIEATVTAASPVVGRGRAAAFSVPVDGQERAVVVAERRAPAEGWDPAASVQDIRAAVWTAHNLALHDVVFTGPGMVPRTSSGKLSRSACRHRYLAGGYHLAVQPVPARQVSAR